MTIFKTSPTRLEPYSSKIIERIELTKAGSTKSTFHISLNIKDSALTFSPGDSIGIFPLNSDEAVEKRLKEMEATGEEIVPVPRSEEMLPLRTLLKERTNLSSTDKFRPLLPRFYSIASSKLAHPEEIHLTVAYFHTGVASSFLCRDALLEETAIPLYVQPNPKFSLPENGSTPIIMIGPGTGIAPYRAFIQERTARGDLGENWLFFGERNRATDFYYEDEWSQYDLRLTTAFSRDQEEKLYVQHQMYEHRQELWKWLTKDATLYVCGDAKQMAKDVHHMLLRIAQETGGLSEEGAREFFKLLRKEGRYLTDVY